jgi:endoglycosylceramidase
VVRSSPALVLLAALGCGGEPPSDAGLPPCPDAAFASGRASVRCQQLVDREGRVVFLHGVNARVAGVFDVTFDDGRAPLEAIRAFAADDAARARAIGFNALRLPINWSALEPTDGAPFSEAYLDRVDEIIGRAADAGLWVLVDFHQDAYSKEIGEDGEPRWAIVPKPTMLLGGPLDDLGARRTSMQVIDAFDTFFGGSKDGTRLRSRYARAVAKVAERLRGDDRVIGIELFNEPIAGTTQLDRLHDEVIAAVRAADPGRLAFFEPDSLRNVTDHASLATRAPWPGTVYAPHVYTLAFTGTPDERRNMTKADLAPSNDNARTEADSWHAPLVITEFGYGPNDIRAADYLRFETELEDQVLASSFFWLWKEESQGGWGLFDHDAKTGVWTERADVRKALTRVTPEAIPGFPTSFGFDPEAKRFELVYDGDASITAPLHLYVPAPEDFSASFAVSCDGAANDAKRDPATGLVELSCNGAGRHTVVLVAR